MSKRTALVVATLALALAANADAKTKTQAKPQSCPSISILADAVRLTQMDSGRIDLKAEIRQPELACTLSGGKAKSKLSFWVKSAISPNSEIAPRSVPYFVAIISEGQVIGKEIFTLAIPFANGTRKLSVKEKVGHIDIPVAPGKTAEDYSVTIGFQLTEEQANYNRTASR
ncbi:MAG: hypothetical protein K8S25_01695 [Alphaproteobacteria bacterium]|nr:hypothetical protein [Alphaproteobacteria bacterium]